MFQTKYLRLGCLVIVFLLASVVMASAQQQQEPTVEVRFNRGPRVIGQSEESYTLGKSDIVQINVQNQPEFSGRFPVGPDGNIQYSFVGDVEVEGLTKDGLKQVLVEKLEKFVKSPVVSVAIAEYQSKVVYIVGAVNNPGKYPMVGDAVLLRDAIFAAGLPTRDAALRRSYVIKSDRKKPAFKKVDLFKIIYRGVTKDNVNLVPGDIVLVPTTIPSEINSALKNLLSPFSSAVQADLLRKYRWGATSWDED
ncbi:polysaccharide biosynthesis/export family protein [Candidatus Omnitrophota bacterium]